MNSLNPWERTLSNWTPRRPSAGLRRRLFGPRLPLSRSAVWLPFVPPAFAAAALALTLMVHPNRLESSVRGSAYSTNFALAALHQSAALQSAQNSLSSPSFAWTNAALAPSTNGSFGGL